MKKQDEIRLQKSAFEKSRIALLKFLIIVFPMWLSAKYYNGPYLEFVRTYFTSIILIILIGLLLQLVFTKASEKGVVLAIFIVLTLVLIVNQLIPSLFSQIGFNLGSARFLSGEYPINLIPYYGVGGFIGFFVLKQCRKN